MTKAFSIDSYDAKILDVLSQDGRISWRDLAERINLSLTPTLRRVRRLEEEGVIQGYAARLDRNLLVGAMTVFITVTMERQIDEVMAGFEGRMTSLPEVLSVFLMTGASDYLLHATVRDLDHYRDLLAELTRIPGVAHIQSSFALKTVASNHTAKILPFPDRRIAR